MSSTRLLSLGRASRSASPSASLATPCCAAALALAAAAPTLAPPADPAGLAQCVCAALAAILGFCADRTQGRTACAVCELLASVALLASASAAATQVLLAEPRAVRDAWLALVGLGGAFAFACALLGASRALERLGTGVSP